MNCLDQNATRPSGGVNLAFYQRHAVNCLLRALPRCDGVILELGSDIEAKVVRALAVSTAAEVIGMNPSAEFPRLIEGENLPPRVKLLREDGRNIPMPDASVDAVLTIATVEHVIGLDAFYSEIHRVLKPGGVLHADFAPIWSCYQGHHTFVVHGAKEVRYWKSGRNPVPDFAHLLLTPEEMREFLHGGPCAPELVEPIVQWIYFNDGINRCFLEDHLAALEHSGLWCQRLARKPGVNPDAATALRLRAKYGGRNFSVFGLEATMRKPGGGCTRMGVALRRTANNTRQLAYAGARLFAPTLRQVKMFRDLLDRRHAKKVK